MNDVDSETFFGRIRANRQKGLAETHAQGCHGLWHGEITAGKTTDSTGVLGNPMANRYLCFLQTAASASGARTNTLQGSFRRRHSKSRCIAPASSNPLTNTPPDDATIDLLPGSPSTHPPFMRYSQTSITPRSTPPTSIQGGSEAPPPSWDEGGGGPER
eukprot:CAMPEP_0114157442 /NCGR_PEP_ID=MMETSP0043_2-20121206/26620_1 /TAXON_ID=464988 /ORGANISM="Hemiselmis andersenii, Strain CCMP644" /LENGTH=158 /DNA_ID=CAMNT_0001253003 /DNA_START=335 /DNA_END=809 /DNA_ORIENTATION=-